VCCRVLTRQNYPISTPLFYCPPLGFDKPPWDQSPAERSTPRVSPSGAVSHLWDDASDALLAYSGGARVASRETAGPGSAPRSPAIRGFCVGGTGEPR
jgi:hypothetical protein